MDINIRGIIQLRDKGHKRTKVVILPEGSRIRSVHELAVDLPVNKGTITAEIARLHSAKAGDIVWPGHVIARDIDQEPAK